MREESDKNIPKKLLEYMPMVHFLGKALGTNYEVFLYDLTKKGLNYQVNTAYIP